MSDADHILSRDEQSALILRHLDGELRDDELRQLTALLEDSAFQLLFARYAVDAAVLYEIMQAQASVATLDQRDCAGRCSADRGLPRRSSRPALWAACLAAVVGGIVAWRGMGDPHADLAAAGVSLNRVTGKVLVDGLPARADWPLRPGQKVQTFGGSAWLAFGDGTQLQVAGDSTVACEVSDGQKRVRILRGHIAASVAPQPPGRPMLIQTGTALMEVVGTELAVSAEQESTRLNVVSGAVKFRRQADGKEVLVRRGQYAVAARHALVEAQDSTLAPDLWSVDFGHGLPTSWTRGVLVEDRAAEGGKAVETELASHDGFYIIRTNNAWSDGLFRVNDDTYLNFRIKMERPEWYQVFVCFRDDYYRSPDDFPNREYQELIDFSKIPPGQWRTVSIPLSEFRRPVPEFTAPEETPPYRSLPKDPPGRGMTVFELLLSTQAHDRGLAVDRIWVTRGRPAAD